MYKQKPFDANSQSEIKLTNSRRSFLKASVGACALFTLPLVASHAHAKIMQPTEKKIAFLNLHTSERIKTTYWAEGEYIPESLQAIRNVLRDHRSGDLHTMDTNLFDMLHLLQRQLGSDQEFNVISAFRSEKTNAMLAARSGGVARSSFHTQGKAIDIRLPGSALADVHTAALSLNIGGVGYYPRSDFIHVDTGHTRSWGG